MGSTTPTDGHLRAALLDRARDAVTRDRAATHGRAEDSFARIAALWSADLGIPLTAGDVARMMVLFKVARAKGNPGHADNWIDMAGYAAIGGELGGAVVPRTTVGITNKVDSRGWPYVTFAADGWDGWVEPPAHPLGQQHVRRAGAECGRVRPRQHPYLEQLHGEPGLAGRRDP
ncbi:DUF6378 domain-containing protein [Amaricoccus solimangrovi]|uniref:DUF6378 domain-containing protein n=1 Tax=Amaricoccus solimangrovi TaxID=2589815 RepID=UPI0015E38B84|nr:DUF6378 domain-containing protein [Amaricoccus solimangrovi]